MSQNLLVVFLTRTSVQRWYGSNGATAEKQGEKNIYVMTLEPLIWLP